VWTCDDDPVGSCLLGAVEAAWATVATLLMLLALA
jgi:hypothetical protein